MRCPIPPHDTDLNAAICDERHSMEKAEVPIVTVSATFRKELADKYQVLIHPHSDVIFSRAHYSMAEAIRQQALLEKKTSYLIDPTNYVSKSDWPKIEFTQTAGQVVARNSLLKWLKDKVSWFARNKLPLSQAITPPLLYLTENVHHPIIALHYEAGRILAHHHKKLLQVVTDPHVHPQYVYFANHTNASFAVFDHSTQKLFLKMAHDLGYEINSDRVIVTGPPIDPRVAALSVQTKALNPNEPVNLAITTGGLGTNLDEVKQVLDQFTPLLHPPEKIRLFLYAGTHNDFRNFFENYAAARNIRVGNWDDPTARIRILHDDSIIDANENLIKYAFPWAHGFITKPSGDMAYDAAAAGCFLLFLHPWAQPEENIQKTFIKLGVGHDLNVSEAHRHFTSLLTSGVLAKSHTAAHNLPPLFREGSHNILAAAAAL